MISTLHRSNNMCYRADWCSGNAPHLHLHSPEVRSNYGQDTGHPEVLRRFPQYCWQILRQTIDWATTFLPSKSFPIHFL
jgi:hypothetical protein